MAPASRAQGNDRAAGARPRQSRRWLYRTKWWLGIAVAFHLACAAVLVPVASHPYDLAVLTGNAEAWLNWGFSPFYNWKFGIDYAALAVLAQSLRAFLSALGVPGIAALHIAWKLPLVVANLLTAGVIYRLALKIGPNRAPVLAALWLVNPAVLWISAGHGQVESIAVLTVFAAMLFALEGHLTLAGIITGLGIGIEYFPVAVVGAVLMWWRGGHLRGRRPLVGYAVGLSIALVVCFVPLLLDPVARAGLFGGLAASSGLSIPSASFLSAWAWVNFQGSGIWPVMFIASTLLSGTIAWRYASRGMFVGVAFVASVLLLAVLLDVNSLALFAVIAAAGLWMFAMVVPIAPVALVLLPTAGAATAFLWLDGGASDANAYFYDDWANTGAELWRVPQSEQLAIFAGHLFSLGLVVAVVYAIMRGRAASRRSWTTSAAVGATICLALVVWASQPAIWQSALTSATTANLPDFQPFVASRAGTVTAVDRTTVRVSYPEALVLAAKRSSVQPSAALTVSMQDLYSRAALNTARLPLAWTDRTVLIPGWGHIQASLQSVWVQLLLGSTDWSGFGPPDTSGLGLTVNGVFTSPSGFRLVAAQPGFTGWALVDFRVPTSDIDQSGRMDLLPAPLSVLWNGSEAGPWVRVAPASGAFDAVIDDSPARVSIQAEASGNGYLSGVPMKTTFDVSASGSALPLYRITGAVLRWPETPELWQLNPWIRALGALYGLLLAGSCTYMLRLALRAKLVWTTASPYPAHGRPNSTIAPHWPSPSRDTPGSEAH